MPASEGTIERVAIALFEADEDLNDLAGVEGEREAWENNAALHEGFRERARSVIETFEGGGDIEACAKALAATESRIVRKNAARFPELASLRFGDDADWDDPKESDYREDQRFRVRQAFAVLDRVDA